MTDSAAPTDRLRAILVLVATLATIGFNFLAAAGYINGTTPEEISNKYLTPVTPAGYAFAIWSLIYAGLIAFSIYQLLPAKLVKYRGIRTLYIISCVLNCAWIYFWHHEQILVCFLVIALLAFVLFLICRSLKNTDSLGEYWLAKAPFSVYFGWLTAATLVSLAILLAYLKLDISDSAWTTIAVVLIATASILAVLVRRWLINDLYPLAIAWALTAIAVKQSGNTPIVIACALGVCATLIATLSFVVNLPSRTTPRTIER